MRLNKPISSEKFKENTEQLVDPIKSKREFYSLVLVLFPTILVSICAQYIPNFFVRAIAMTLLVFFQAVIVKGLIENRN